MCCPRSGNAISCNCSCPRSKHAITRIAESVGEYDWIIGDDGNATRDRLMTFVTADALQNLVQFNTEALGLDSVYKENLTQ